MPSSDRPSQHAVHGYVSGVVQGVGFRWFAAAEARRLGIDGWVRNLPDGRVEFHAQGAPEALARFEEALRRGPRSARVTDVTLEPVPADPARRGFDITY